MKKFILPVLISLWTSTLLFADAGILLPRDKQQPDPAILSLEEMEITVRIDNGDARVFVRQVFANHTSGIQEGNYIFALPSHATISDFATWDGPTRIPAVILERKRAEEIYTQLKQQAIDPGLLQMGERGAEEAKRTSVFSARIVPIPAYGTKRLEIEYHESVPVENLKSFFPYRCARMRIRPRPRACFASISNCTRPTPFATSRRPPEASHCNSSRTRLTSSKATWKDRTSTWAKTS